MARLGAALMLVFLLATPAGAQAVAPQYVSSEPEDGAMLDEAPEEVRVTFSEPLDESSKLIVEDHCGDRIDDGNVTISTNEMAVGIAEKPSGHYMVTYSAVGLAGATGTNNGRFSFMVHSGDACDGGPEHGGHGNENEPGKHENHPGKNEGEHGRHEGERGEHGNRNHMGGHEAGTDHTDGHETASGAHPSDHSMENRHGGHRDQVAAARQQREQRDKRLQAIATGESPFPALAPDSTAILLALVLCAAFGGLGGWLLRVSARS